MVSPTAAVPARRRTVERCPSEGRSPGRRSTGRRGPARRAALAALPGLVAAVALGAVATALGGDWPLLGAPVIAVVAGVLLSPLVRRRREIFAPGVGFAKDRLLQTSVVLLGAQLSLSEVAGVGVGSLPVMLGTLAACLFAAWWIGRRFGIDRDLRTLVGVGTAICGASAIAAVSPAIRAKSADVAYAISTIFLFNIAAVLVFPPLGHALGMSQDAFGLFAGTAVNDTSSVVATASSYGEQATQHAVVVKLVRTLMIIPIVLVLGALAARRERRDAGGEPVTRTAASRVLGIVRLVPWFLAGFVLVVVVNSAGAIPEAAQPGIHAVALFLIAVALGAIGLSTDPQALRRAGPRPLLLGLVLWVLVAGTSLGLQALTGAA